MSGEGRAGPPGLNSRLAFSQSGRGRGRFPPSGPGGDRFPGPSGPGGPPPFPGEYQSIYCLPTFWADQQKCRMLFNVQIFLNSCFLHI